VNQPTDSDVNITKFSVVEGHSFALQLRTAHFAMKRDCNFATSSSLWLTVHGPARPALDCVPSVLLVRLPGMICRLICATWTYL